MVEAAQETIGPTAIWVVCIIMALVAGFMVTAPLVANSRQAKSIRRIRMAHQLGPSDEPSPSPVGASAEAQGDIPTQIDLPAQAGPAQAGPAQPSPAGTAAMPAQRTGDADRAERTQASPGTPGE